MRWLAVGRMVLNRSAMRADDVGVSISPSGAAA